MKRAVLLVSGARLGNEVTRRMAKWWESGREEVLLLEVEAPGRLVLVDIDSPEPRVAGDTARGEGLVVLNLPDGSADLEAALKGAHLLGAEREALARVVRALLPDVAVAEPPPESVDPDEPWLSAQKAGEDGPPSGTSGE